MFLWPNYVKPISLAKAKYVLDDRLPAISFKQLKSLAILNKNLYNFTEKQGSISDALSLQ